MDELYEQMIAFLEMMSAFNNSVAVNWDALQGAYQNADEVWDESIDRTRRQFESEWSSMHHALNTYRTEHSEAYMRFLLQRKAALDEYFGN
jgi:hypothetical protein